MSARALDVRPFLSHSPQGGLWALEFPPPVTWRGLLAHFEESEFESKVALDLHGQVSPNEEPSI